MIDILHTEFFRLKKSKLFWAMLGVCAGLPLFTALMYTILVGFSSTVGVVGDSSVEISFGELIRSVGIAETSLSGVASVMSDATLISVITTSIFLSRDFSCGTFRNMLLANKSRLQLYLSHITMAVTIGSCYMGVSLVSTLLFQGSIFGFRTLGAFEVITGCLVILAMGLVSVILVQTMVCMFLFGTRKLAVALACPIAICIFAPTLVMTFVQMYQILTEISSGTTVVSDFSWVPLYNSGLIDIANLDGALVGKILMYNIPLAILFGFLGWVWFRKADLK